jgi:hypothetical protein
MARIFINYRRDDTSGVAGRLSDYLALKYSRRELFMDVDAMQPGRDFAKQLDSQVAQCQVLLAMIGPHWLDARDQTGKRRLDNDRDYVRIEIAAALKRDIAVVPVLLDGTAMPPEESLPDDLKPLVRRQALELRHTRFTADADAIVHALEAVVPRRGVPWLWVGGGVALAAVAAAILLWPKLHTRQVVPLPATVTAKQAVVNPPAASPSPPVQPAVSSPLPSPQQPSAAAPATPALEFGLPAGVQLGEMLAGTALPGSVLRVTDISADPAICQASCRAEPRCAAWTYTQPKGSDAPARCSLKEIIPARVPDQCCTSGIEREPPPELREPPPLSTTVAGARRGIELLGGTYRYFGDATPETCQTACRAESQCLAWDYVRPGIYSHDARCFLKDKTSRPVASPCCIAGFERAESK